MHRLRHFSPLAEYQTANNKYGPRQAKRIHAFLQEQPALAAHGAEHGWLFATAQPVWGPPVMVTTYGDGEMYASGWVHESDEGDWYAVGVIPAENLAYPLVIVWHDAQEVAR